MTTDTTADHHPAGDPDRPRLGPAFLTVWAGQTVSLIGTTATAVGAALWAFMETGSVVWLSVLYLAGQLPALLVSSFAGSLVDRRSRKPILLVADAFAALGSLAALALHLTVGLEPWHLVVVVATSSLANGFQDPAYQASLPLLVPREALARANGLIQLAPAVSLIAGAPFAGLALGLGGIGTVLVADLASFGIAVVATAVSRIPDPTPAPATDGAEPTPGRGSLLAVWRHLSGPLAGLRRLALSFAAVNLMLTLGNVLFLALLLTVTTEQNAGLVSGLSGAAMVIASLVVAKRGVPADRVRVIVAGIAGTGIGLAVAGARPSLVTITLGLVIMLSSAPVAAAASTTLFMETVAPSWHGRLQAFRRVMSQTLVPVAVLAVGPLVDQWAEPAMQPGRPLAATLGRLLGTGQGRGIAVVFVGAGLGVLAIAAVMATDQRLRRMTSATPVDPNQFEVADSSAGQLAVAPEPAGS